MCWFSCYIAHGSTLTIPPGQTVRGSWLIEYDTDEHPELANIAEENEWWFDGSPDEFHWGRVKVPGTGEDNQPFPRSSPSVNWATLSDDGV